MAGEKQEEKKFAEGYVTFTRTIDPGPGFKMWYWDDIPDRVGPVFRIKVEVPRELWEAPGGTIPAEVGERVDPPPMDIELEE